MQGCQITVRTTNEHCSLSLSRVLESSLRAWKEIYDIGYLSFSLLLGSCAVCHLQIVRFLLANRKRPRKVVVTDSHFSLTEWVTLKRAHSIMRFLSLYFRILHRVLLDLLKGRGFAPLRCIFWYLWHSLFVPRICILYAQSSVMFYAIEFRAVIRQDSPISDECRFPHSGRQMDSVKEAMHKHF